MDRRSFLAGGAAAVAAMSALETSARASGSERPNFMWFLSEDCNPFIGAYGDPLARTPTIDQLAAEGVRYDTVYSRGAGLRAVALRAARPACTPRAAGPAHHMRAIAKMPSCDPRLPGVPARARATTARTTRRRTTTRHRHGRDVGRVSSGERALAYAARGQRRSSRCSPTRPRTSRGCSTTTPVTTDPATMRVPPYLPDTPRRSRATERASTTTMARMDARARRAAGGARGRRPRREHDRRSSSATTAACCRASKRFANDDGLRVPLIVRVPAEVAAPRARAARAASSTTPVSCVDFPPTLLSLAGVPVPEPHARRRSSSASACSRAGLRVRACAPAWTSATTCMRTVARRALPLHPQLHAAPPLRPAHGATCGSSRGYQDWEQAHLDGDAQRRCRSAFFDDKPAEELYDLERRSRPAQQPRRHAAQHEDDAAAAAARARRAPAARSTTTASSPRARRSRATTRAARPARTRSGCVLRVAETRDRARPRQPRPRCVRDLGDANEIVRYWAAQGLLMLGDAAQPRGRSAQRSAGGAIRRAQVRILARRDARAARPHRSPGAVPRWTTLDTHANIRVRLQAANAITYVGVAALPYMPVIERAANSHRRVRPQRRALSASSCSTGRTRRRRGSSPDPAAGRRDVPDGLRGPGGRGRERRRRAGAGGRGRAVRALRRPPSRTAAVRDVRGGHRATSPTPSATAGRSSSTSVLDAADRAGRAGGAVVAAWWRARRGGSPRARARDVADRHDHPAVHVS